MYNEDDRFIAYNKAIDEMRLEIVELMEQDQLSEGNLRRIDYLERSMNDMRDRMW
jgi:hypothetical protein